MKETHAFSYAPTPEQSRIVWDDAFDNIGHIANAADYPARWASRAAAFRTHHAKADLDCAYGSDDREVFDLLWPEGSPKGLVVFVHGGFWMKLDKSFWTDLAAGAIAHGWAVCLPSYPLAPNAGISTITRAIGRAISAAADRVAGPIRLAGHSAGGHLVSRMICDDSPLSPAVLARIQHTLSISGLHDLRPLLATTMNETLGLDADEAREESACLHMPHGHQRLTCWVGGDERPEFLRQNALLAMMWAGLGAETRAITASGLHHFDVLDKLADPDSALTQALVSD